MKLKLMLASALVALTASAQQTDATFNGSMLYGLCTNANAANSFNNGTTAGEAMQLTESAIKYFNGCRITAIAVANGALADQPIATEMPVNIFVCDSLGGEPIASVQGSMDLSKPLEYKEYALEKPIDIAIGMEPLYFGFTVECNNKIGFPLVTDSHATDGSTPGDWIGLRNADGTWDWQQAGQQVGSCCVRIKIEGAGLPANNVSIMESHLPTYAAPGSKATVGLFLRNDAGNTVSSVKIDYTANGGETKTIAVDLPAPLIYNDYTLVPVTFDAEMPDIESADVDFKINVAGINAEGAANQAAAASRTAAGTYLSLSKGFDKAVVAEISTGTWCGYCPMGMVAVSKMQQTYPDGRFIPIAVHFGNDVMAETSYSRLSDEITGGNAPACVINRNVESYGVQNPSFNFLSSVYEEVIAEPALVKPAIKNITFDPAKKRLSVDAEAEFAIGVNGNYALAYVITENHVGPYEQHNYYSNELSDETGLPELEGWTDKPEWVETEYNDVARLIYSFYGLKNSLPAEMEAGKTYTHTASLQTNLVGNIDNAEITLMVTNRTTGRIENAVRVPYSKFASISTVEADMTADAPAAVYDLHGRRVSSTRPGQIYISNGIKFIAR